MKIKIMKMSKRKVRSKIRIKSARSIRVQRGIHVHLEAG
jgi:hypothetical protein